MSILTYDEKTFLLDGEPFTVISGAMHYFRIPRAYWRDRLEKLKQCGFNTVETYTCWNLHEREEGKFDFSGGLDIAEYISIAESLGLHVIVRPGPYICAEWEFGGLPAWLLRYPNMALRCNDPVYLEKVRRYFAALFDELRPHLCTNGGGIFMVQIENEYGSYGDDKDYLRAIAQIYRDCGVDVQLFTSDGSCQWMLGGGTLPEQLCVVNFGADPEQKFAALERFRQNQPTMCGEYWCGWFDHWYEHHHVRAVETMVDPFAAMLARGASVNFYMFHGGTNFGFTNGANCTDVYQPTVTSYDYCALLSEAGDLTPAYHAVRRAVEAHLGKTLPPLTVKNTEKAAYGRVKLDRSASLLSQYAKLGTSVHTAAPKYMEEIGQDFGFTMYTTTVHGPMESIPLEFDVCHDRAIVFINGKFAGIRERDRRHDEIRLALAAGESARVEILCENMGRVNYGIHLRDPKGITGIRFGQRYHFGWEMTALPMEDLSALTFETHTGAAEAATFLSGTLHIEGEPHDTFVRLDGFHHGFVTVNGVNLGRYYNDAGPQKTLFVPAPFLHTGENEVIVFEADGCEADTVEFTDVPDLGVTDVAPTE